MMRKFRSKSQLVCLAITCVTLLCVACSETDESHTSTAVLSRGLNGDPESLDPHKFSSTQAGDVLRDIGEGLMSSSPTGAVVKGVAESWQRSPDGLIYTFHIKQEARWSSGEPLTAEDFVHSFRRIFNPQTASTGVGRLNVILNANSVLSGELAPQHIGVRSIDERTLEVRLENPTPYFLSLLTHPSAYPIHRSALLLGPEEGPFKPNKFVSNGAYKLVDRVPGSEITLHKNEFYWDSQRTYFDIVKYHVVSPAREVVRYLAGDLDVTSNVDADSFVSLQESHSNQLKIAPFLGTYYYGLNLSKEPFESSVQLREALFLAIDRQTIVEFVTKRGEAPAYTLVPPGVSNYSPPSLKSARMTQAERESRARQLYSEAGYSPENPISVELRFNTGGGHEKIALAVRSMWEKVLGADVTLVKEEFRVFIDNVMAKEETDVFRLSWTGTYDDAQSFLQLFQTGNPNNLTGYSNAKVDELLHKGAHDLDENRRSQLLQRAEVLALSEFPLIPIYFFVSKHLVAPRICGWHSNLLDYNLSKHLYVCEGDYD